MTSQSMYINPAILAALVAILMALVTIGGILWNASRNLATSFGELKTNMAESFGEIKTDVAVIRERLDNHIENDSPRKTRR